MSETHDLPIFQKKSERGRERALRSKGVQNMVAYANELPGSGKQIIEKLSPTCDSLKKKHKK